MKKLAVILMLVSGYASGQEPLYDNTIFENSLMSGYYYYSHATYQSPSWIKNQQQKLPVNGSVFFTPGNSLELQYVNGGKGYWKATIGKPAYRGQDLICPGTVLHMKIFVQSATLAGELPAVQISLKNGKSSDSIPLSKYIKQYVTGKWLAVAVPLSDFAVSEQNSVDVAAVHFVQQSQEGKEHHLLIDQVEILPAALPAPPRATPAIAAAKGWLKHVDIEWKPIVDSTVKYVKVYRSEDGGRNFNPVGIMMRSIHRYADYTGETGKAYQYKISLVGYDYTESPLSAPVSAFTHPMPDDELLTMVQEACFRYYWEGAEANSGLAKENIPGRSNMIAAGASGFGMMALLVGTERKFITRQQAVGRFLQVINFLEKTETFHGAYSHFIDGPTARVNPFFGPKDNGGDLVETAFLMQGLLAARAYFTNSDLQEKQIRDRITAIWQRVEWDWYRRTPDSKFLYWHWSPDQAWVINHRLIGWNETMITYLLAMASPAHAIPDSLYYSGWANQDTTGRQYREGWGGTSEGSGYTNGNTYSGIKLDVGVSTGGPLFFTHYSYLAIDPHLINDRYANYFNNNRNIALINYRYCIENPGKFQGYGDSCWGLTASDGPGDYSADEPVPGRDIGKIAPTGAISSFPYTPAESMKALKNYYNNYGKFLWGEYGFRDAFALTRNWCSSIYMGLNQAPMAVMIENYRSGLLWKIMARDPDVQRALKKLADPGSRQKLQSQFKAK